jgi:AcrR family transcriptional regulator
MARGRRLVSSPDSPRDAPVPAIVGSMRDAAVLRTLDTQRGAAAESVDAILDAGYRLIERDGVLELNMRELLAEAGSSNRAFYRHFTSKDVLLMTLVDDVYKVLCTEIDERMGRGKDPVAKLRIWINGLLDRGSDAERTRLGRPFVVHAARLGEQFPDVYRSIGHRLIGQVQQVIEEGIAERVFASSTPRRDARMVFQLTLAIMQSHVMARTRIKPAEREAVINFSLRALEPIR